MAVPSCTFAWPARQGHRLSFGLSLRLQRRRSSINPMSQLRRARAGRDVDNARASDSSLCPKSSSHDGSHDACADHSGCAGCAPRATRNARCRRRCADAGAARRRFLKGGAGGPCTVRWYVDASAARTLCTQRYIWQRHGRSPRLKYRRPSTRSPCTHRYP